MNLVSNALRYTESGGVLLACRRRGDRAILQVWDTGIGIPENQRQAIFSEYVQLGNPARTHGKGLGLGLAICDRLSQLLELPMGVDSSVGRGSVFWIEVPLAVAAETEPIVSSAIPAVDLRGTIVVLEDDELIASGMAGLIGGWGCQVVVGTSSEEVIRQCERAGVRPNAIIADYRLGGEQNGLDAALALRRRYGEIPVLLTTGSAEPGLVKGATARGFIELTKPVRPGKLRAVLQSMLVAEGDEHAETSDVAG
jgi:CheY-like chemotaxis protein